MLPVYDPKSFASIDLRKYHIRDIKDIIRFNEFVTSRMEEAQFVLKKFATQHSTYKSIVNQLQNKVAEQQKSYGNPNASQEDQNKAKIETAEPDKNASAEAEHNQLLDEIRQAVAEESVAPTSDDSDDEFGNDTDRKTVELGKYKLVICKNGKQMFYRDNSSGKKTLVSIKDVPEDIKQQLINIAEDK